MDRTVEISFYTDESGLATREYPLTTHILMRNGLGDCIAQRDAYGEENGSVAIILGDAFTAIYTLAVREPPRGVENLFVLPATVMQHVRLLRAFPRVR